jgi:hypothetical protein
MSNIFSISDDGKVLKFKGETIDLIQEKASNKRFESDHKYSRIPLYNKTDDTSPINEKFPLPDASGRQYLFNNKKTDHGNLGTFITNMDDTSSLREREWGVIMGVSCRFFPFLPFEVMKIIDKANYKLVIENADSQRKLELPLLAIPQSESVNAILPSIADSGESGGESIVTVIKNEPLKLDASRYMLLRPSTVFHVYIEPENYSEMDNMPSPESDPAGIRYHLMIKLHGLFTNVEGLY